MSLAQNLQAINAGLFDSNYPPDDLLQVLQDGTQRAVNWNRVRLAVEALAEMPWYKLDGRWSLFLDRDRYPLGSPLDLAMTEINLFRGLVREVRNQTLQGIQILTSVQPSTSLTDVSVAVDANDLPTLAAAVNHIQRTIELAAVDDAITISSFQSGSLEIFMTAGNASLFALKLAITLAKVLKDPSTSEKVRDLKNLLSRNRPDAGLSDEEVIEIVQDGARDTFWENAEEPLREAVELVGKNLPEAKNKITQAANEIYQNADQVSANWNLPPAVVSGLPGGITISLNLDNPESIGRVIRAISAP